jgi:surfeit locus 1 family protein
VILQFGHRRLAFGWREAALAAIGIAAFAHLGVWQLGRAAEKRELLESYEHGGAAVDVQNDIAQLPRYQSVRITGRYDSAHQVLLDNMHSQRGQPGYRVITPFESPQGWLLIDRGWIAPGATRAQLPDVGVDENSRTVVARIDELPRPGIRLAASADSNVPQGWPRVLNYPTHADLERALQRPVANRLLLLDAKEPDGYERTSAVRLSFGPERNVGYAVQWFAMAAAVAVIFIVLGFRAGARHR